MSEKRENNALLSKFCFSEAEQETFLLGVWELFAKQVQSYNGCDSTSLRTETAEELLQSLVYTLEVGSRGLLPQQILSQDLSILLDRGRECLKERKKAAKVQWELLCRQLVPFENGYLKETVQNIGAFFQRYDIYYGAHQIPCSIEYWLLCPVSEEKRGLDYIEEYLHRLQIEDDFVQAFDQQIVLSLYGRHLGDETERKEAFFNLCEPILTNAVCLEMVSGVVELLRPSTQEKERLKKLLQGQTEGELGQRVNRAVLEICQRIGMTDPEEERYLTQAAQGIPIRLLEAERAGTLSCLLR